MLRVDINVVGRLFVKEQVALTQVKAMLQEITAANYPGDRKTQTIMSIGSTAQPDWTPLAHVGELADMLGEVKQALPVMKEGMIMVGAQVWQDFENLYSHRVVQKIFT